MDKGIEILVGILNSKGLPTTLSCAGHRSRGTSAWVELEGAHFKHYASRSEQKLEQFLKAGEGRWFLTLTYRAESVFPGIGRLRPRIKSLRREVQVNLVPTFHLRVAAIDSKSGLKCKLMCSMERAATSLL